MRGSMYKHTGMRTLVPPPQAATLRLPLIPWGHPAHLLKFSFRALSSREASSEIQEAHAVTHPAAHLKYTMAVSDGLSVALGCLAVGTHMEAERGRWCGRHTSQCEDRFTEEHSPRGCKTSTSLCQDDTGPLSTHRCMWPWSYPASSWTHIAHTHPVRDNNKVTFSSPAAHSQYLC